jgi:telomere length regulation protein
VITFVVKQYFSSNTIHHDDSPLPESNTVSSVANLVHTLVKDSESLRDHLISILARSSIPSLDDSLDARRSVMAALSQDEGNSQRMQHFGDILTIGRQVTYVT